MIYYNDDDIFINNNEYNNDCLTLHDKCNLILNDLTIFLSRSKIDINTISNITNLVIFIEKIENNKLDQTFLNSFKKIIINFNIFLKKHLNKIVLKNNKNIKYKYKVSIFEFVNLIEYRQKKFKTHHFKSVNNYINSILFLCYLLYNNINKILLSEIINLIFQRKLNNFKYEYESKYIQKIIKPLANNTIDLYFNCKNGLGDKLFSLIGLATYSFFSNKNINIIFNQNNEQGIFGLESRSNIYDTILFNFQNIPINILSNKFHHNLLYINDIYSKPIESTSIYLIYEILKFEYNISLKQIINKYKSLMQNLLSSDIINKYIPKDIKNCYGIHLRTTDKINGIRLYNNFLFEISLTEFERIINKLFKDLEKIIIKKSLLKKKITFFICSDNKEYKQLFLQKLLKICIKYNANVSFINTDDIQINQTDKLITGFYAALDFFILAKCKYIFQTSFSSTFAMVASVIGNSLLINYSNYIRKKSDVIKKNHYSLVDQYSPILKLKNKDIFGINYKNNNQNFDFEEYKIMHDNMYRLYIMNYIQ